MVIFCCLVAVARGHRIVQTSGLVVRLTATVQRVVVLHSSAAVGLIVDGGRLLPVVLMLLLLGVVVGINSVR